MKFVQTYIVFLASGLASALPTSHSGIESSLVQDLHPALLDVRSINEPNQALQTLERRFDFRQCRRIGSTILRIGTSAAGVAFINSAAGLAQQICEEQGAPGCAQYIGYIQHGMNAIFVFATYAHGAVGEGRSGEQSSVENGIVKRSSLIGLSGLGSALNDGGYSFDSVERIDIAALKLDKRDSSDPILTHRSIFRNLTNEDGSPSSDVAFNYFDNGDVNMDIAGDMGTLAADGGVETSGLQKRYDGPGFKISWTSRKRSLLTRAHQNQMSYEIARDWADKAAFLGEGDYIGLVKTDHTANFYFRIIPETRGFGLNYESVNVCGQLAPFL